MLASWGDLKRLYEPKLADCYKSLDQTARTTWSMVLKPRRPRCLFERSRINSSGRCSGPNSPFVHLSSSCCLRLFLKRVFGFRVGSEPNSDKVHETHPTFLPAFSVGRSSGGRTWRSKRMRKLFFFFCEDDFAGHQTKKQGIEMV